jgi:hypothetical protein
MTDDTHEHKGRSTVLWKHTVTKVVLSRTWSRDNNTYAVEWRFITAAGSAIAHCNTLAFSAVPPATCWMYEQSSITLTVVLNLDPAPESPGVCYEIEQHVTHDCGRIWDTEDCTCFHHCATCLAVLCCCADDGDAPDEMNTETLTDVICGPEDTPAASRACRVGCFVLLCPLSILYVLHRYCATAVCPSIEHLCKFVCTCLGAICVRGFYLFAFLFHAGALPVLQVLLYWLLRPIGKAVSCSCQMLGRACRWVGSPIGRCVRCVYACT